MRFIRVFSGQYCPFRFLLRTSAPFVLSLWFDRLTMIGFFPNVLSEVEGQAQGEAVGSGLAITHLA